MGRENFIEAHMIMGIYVVYDRVAEQSMPIFESRNDGTALRAYQKAIIEQDDIPEKEMMLLRLGEIDHNTNLIYLEEHPIEVDVKLSLAEEYSG